MVVVLWSVSLTVMVLATGSRKLAEASLGSLRDYLAGLLAPAAVVVPLVVVVGGYVVWKALRGDGAWRLLALALLFQAPVCVLVVVHEWAARQFLVVQALMLCALGALVVDAGEAAWRGRAYSARLGGAVVALPLAILLLAFSVGRVQALLPEERVEGVFGEHRVAPQATAMAEWMEENVPEGERILVNAAQGQYLAYLDGGRHEWTRLHLDQGICKPRPNIQIRCDPEKNAISRIPPNAIWVQRIDGNCRVISLSMSNLLRQVDESRASYVMIAGSPEFPSILELPSALQESDAFEVVHAELAQTGESGVNQGVVLLKSTGRAPKALPTQMNANTMQGLKRCEQVEVQGMRRG